MNIKLSISRHFLEALVNLSKTDQKRTREFMRKFQENPESPAINLEKIESFKDPNLRSARVSQDIRAIIHVPDSGQLYHVLWVDNHDEAYRWAANKTFEWNRITQNFQYYETPEADVMSATDQKSQDSSEAFIQGESEKPSSILALYTDEQLVRIGVPIVLMPSIRKVVSYEDLQNLEPYLPEQAFENLYYLLDGIPYDEVADEIALGKPDKPLEEESPEESYNYQREFVVITDDETLEEVLSDSFEAWRAFLHPSQRALAYNEYNGAVKVTGGAGTGKTVAAMHRARNLTRENTNTIRATQSQPLLFTTFTRALSRNLGELLQKIGANMDVIHLENIHSFIVSKAKELGILESASQIIDFMSDGRKEALWSEVLEKHLSEYDSTFLINEYEQIIQFHDIHEEIGYLRIPRRGRRDRLSRPQRKKVWRLIQEYRALKKQEGLFELNDLTNELTRYYQKTDQKPFSHIIADEIQDFTNVELRLLRAMTDEQKNDLYLTGDPFQTIYKKQVSFSECGINIRGRRSRRLKINYRTTEEIRRLAVATIKNIPYDNFDGEAESGAGYVSLMHGQEPVYELFKTKEEELEYIAGQIKPSLDEFNEQALPLSAICIACRTKDGLKDIQKHFHNMKIPYRHYSDDSLLGADQGVLLSTLHNMKGLEFKKVILADINNQTMPLKPYNYNNWTDDEKGEHEKRERALLYVAMTRAINELSITGTGNGTRYLS